MSFNNYDSVLEFLDQNEELSFEDSYSLLSYVNKQYKINEHDGRDIIIRILEKSAKFHSGCKDLLNALVEIYGLYPYVDEKLLTGSSSMRYELHKSPFLTDVYLHQE